MGVGRLWLFKVAGSPAFSRSTNLESKLMDIFAFLNGWLKWVGQLWQSELLFNRKYTQKTLVFRGVPILVIAWWGGVFSAGPRGIAFSLRLTTYACQQLCHISTYCNSTNKKTFHKKTISKVHSFRAYVCCLLLASFPGPTQLFVACSTNNDGKLGGAWEQGYSAT